MDYIDLNGKIVKNKTGQDKLLEFLYTNFIGRMLLKPLVTSKFSVLAGKLLSTNLSTVLIPSFIKKNGIPMEEYDEKHFHSFNDFFTRKIKDGARPFDANPNTLISPCDGKVTVHEIHEDTTFFIKHTEYTLRSLLRSKNLAKRFEGGYLFLLRLTVNDYHRYIYAASGKQSKNYHIPGSFHTVNPIANDYLPIYKENTREYTLIHNDTFGDLLQMEVGALMVGKITNHTQSAMVSKGEEKGYFEYGGSTIILITRKDAVIPRSDLLDNTDNGYETKILQGQPLGAASK
jgi:phosphatidylserine decarboxylase